LITPPTKALNAAQQFDRFGVDLPDEAQRWVQRLNELRQNRPEAPAHNGVAGLIAYGAKPATIDAAIAEYVGHAHRQQQHQMAENIVGQRTLAAILNDRDRLHRELAATATDIIDRLHQAAAIDETAVELIKQRRTTEAHAVATADSDAAELRNLYQLRDRFLIPPQARWSTGWWSCAEFESPWDIEHPSVRDDSLWGMWRAEIRAGGRLWFATVEEARAASQPHEPTSSEMLPPDPRSSGMFVG